MTEIRVAVIGCGWVSNGHIRAWRKVKDANVVSVCDVYEEAAKSMAKKWKIDEYYLNFSDLLERSAIDVVDICTPPSTHRDFMVQAMKDGVNAITEKPMTMTVREAQEIVDVKKKTGMNAGVIHNWLFEPTILKADALKKNGHLGDIINVEVEAINTKYDSMVSNKEHWCHQLVGGRFGEMLPHPIYLMRNFLGPDISVESIHVSKIGEYSWMRSDELTAIFRVGDKLGRAYASFNSPREAIFVHIYGKKAYLKTDIINATLTLFPERRNERFSKGIDSIRQAAQLTSSTLKNTARIATGKWDSGVDTIIKRYAESLRKDEDPPVTVEEGLEVTKTLEEMTLQIDKAEKGRVQGV